jgi:hypothetical protein
MVILFKSFVSYKIKVYQRCISLILGYKNLDPKLNCYLEDLNYFCRSI